MLNNVTSLEPQGPDSTAGDDRVAQAADPAYVAKATKAAVEFESFFISHMLHQMRESTRTIAPDDSPTKDKVNQDMTDMVDDMLARNMAHQRAFGVADAILRQILPAPLHKTR